MGDGGEPAHIHVERDDLQAKFWLQPVRLEWSSGFNAKEVNTLQSLIERHRDHLLESWNVFFGS